MKVSCLLHPAILKRYEEQLGRLEEALAKGVCASDGEATEAIRDLVETVTVLRDLGRPGGVAVEIAGRLNALLGEKAYPNQVKGVWGKMVAGGESNPRPEQSDFDSTASGTLRRRAEQIVRFAHRDILFYDEHIIDLYHRISALYRMG